MEAWKYIIVQLKMLKQPVIDKLVDSAQSSSLTHSHLRGLLICL